MKEIYIEVLRPFKYSPNGWDNARAQIGEELYLSEKVAKGLKDSNPPYLRFLDDNFKPKVFSSDGEVIEEILEELPEEIFADSEGDIESVVIEDYDTDIDEIVLSEDGDVVLTVELPELEDLKALIAKADRGFDEMDLGNGVKVVQSNGKWYDIFISGKKQNEKGVNRTKIAEFIYNLKEV